MVRDDPRRQRHEPLHQRCDLDQPLQVYLRSRSQLQRQLAAADDPITYAQNTAELLERAHKLVKLSQAAVDRDALERG